MGQPTRLALLFPILLLQLLGLFHGVSAEESGAGTESVLTSEIGRQNNESLFWGPYKPNLYFGVRPRTPNGLWAGLMWARIDTFQDVQKGFRYTCEQHEIDGYGWDEYDPRKGGVQTIHDEGNQIDITTSLVKIPGGAHGGSWAARIKGVPRKGAPANVKTMLHYYISQDGPDSRLAVDDADDVANEKGFDGDVVLKGESKDLGSYKLVVTAGKGDHPTSSHKLSEERKSDRTIVKSLEVPAEVAWQARGVVYRQISETVEAVSKVYEKDDVLPPFAVYQLEHEAGSGNVHIVQKMFEGEFEFDVLFSSDSAGADLTSEDLTREIKATTDSFSQRFSSIFNLQAPFAAEKYQRFGKSMLSNLLGGIGYFYGDQSVDHSYAPEYDEEEEGFWEDAATARAREKPHLDGPHELFTSVPSRPFFPRGFLWDEGFHLIPIADWDTDLTLTIVESWFKLMDDDGWIAREQILGPEARSKVPEEFQVQYPHYANPPTLFLIVESFMERLRKTNSTQPGGEKGTLAGHEPLRTEHLDNVELGESYLHRIYPLLRRQFQWFRKTQFGDIRSYDREAYSTKEAYRWRGRSETHILTSGIDDYPRPQPPHPGELHVDLMSWVGLMVKSLLNIADALGITDDVKEYESILNAIEHNVNDLHWSEKEGCYCDATIDAFEEHELVCHKGYISLFPFLVGLLKPDDPKLGRLLDLIGDENELWSPHGIRSLSKQDKYYGTGENYWRSPVWMPINYMVVSQLQNVATQQGPFQAKARDLYNRLRENLINTVYNSWEETGFAWEQYNPETGKGQRTQHFTGWTSLVVKIMAMGNVDETGHVRDEL